MKIKNYFFIFLPCIFSNLSYGIDLTTYPFGTVNATVSSKEPNIINVKNDKITHLTSKSEGGIFEDEATEDGSVIFSTKETKTFSILVQTEKGANFIVNAQPNKNVSSRSIVIHNLSDKGNSVSEEVLNNSGFDKSYSGVISYIFKELINGNIPNGFIESRKKDFPINNDLKHILKIRNTDAWVGENIRVIKLDITNISSSEIELNERYLWAKGVMAISFYPNATVLPPNTRIFAYVMVRGE